MCVTMWKSNCSLLVWVYLACNSWQPVLGCVDCSLVDVREKLWLRLLCLFLPAV